MKIVANNLTVLTRSALHVVQSSKKNKVRSFTFNPEMNAQVMDSLAISNTEIIGVGFQNGSVNFYDCEDDVKLVSTYVPQKECCIDVLKFIPFGGKKNLFVSIQNDELDVKYLKKSSKLNNINVAESITEKVEKDLKLSVKKKKNLFSGEIPIPVHTQLYVEYLNKNEKPNLIHKEWARLKLTTVGAYIEAQNLRMIQPENPETGEDLNSFKFSASIDVLGFGNPYFDLAVKISNLEKSVIPELVLDFEYNKDIYELESEFLVTDKFKCQSKTVSVRVKVVASEEANGVTDVVKVFMSDYEKGNILQQVQVDMPPAEVLFF